MQTNNIETMTAKDFIMNKIENEWTREFRDVNYDHMEELAKAFDEYKQIEACPACSSIDLDARFFDCKNCGYTFEVGGHFK